MSGCARVCVFVSVNARMQVCELRLVRQNRDKRDVISEKGVQLCGDSDGQAILTLCKKYSIYIIFNKHMKLSRNILYLYK